MGFNIRMGLPEMARLWDTLMHASKTGNISTQDAALLNKWGKALKLLSQDPRYPSLHTHEIPPLTARYGMRVWQSYLENRNSRAMRMYWVYGPDAESITIISLEPHPEEKKKGAYARIKLSSMPD